jgi:D-arginine dehydrogenase
MNYYDVIVIGGGVAGISAGAEIAAFAKTVVLEAETQPGYHATGRSAAFFTTTYGNGVSQALGRISEIFFRGPPEGFTDNALIHPREQIVVANTASVDRLKAMQSGIAAYVSSIDVDDALARIGILNRDEVAGAFVDGTGGELDAGAILGGYARLHKQRGGELIGNARATSMSFSEGLWTVRTQNGDAFTAPAVVNAAGAWADEVAQMAGLEPLALKPLRRTAILVPPPSGLDMTNLPMLIHLSGGFYFKPDAGMMLVSPMDETEDTPCDVQADEYDVAVAIDRLMNNTSMQVRQVTHRWAGFRTFAEDRNPVVGYDPTASGFFWLAGQGGFGVGSAPALAHLSCALITGQDIPHAFDRVAHMADMLSPARFRVSKQAEERPMASAIA